MYAILALLIFPLSFSFLMWAISAWQEYAHMQSILLREKAFSHLLVNNIRTPPPGACDPELVSGSVVIGAGAWKSMLAGFRTLVGGRMRSLETVVERARREAVLRMLEAAARQGADGVINVRLDTACISRASNDAGAAMLEVIASGTSVRLPR